MTESRTVLTRLAIWDGDGSGHSGADTLIIRGSRIESMCRADELAEPDRRQALSLPGATAIPGLIDAHVHMSLDPQRNTPPGPGEHGDLTAMRERALTMVRAGITSARDLGGGGWLELALRDAINAGETEGPRLLCAGQPVTTLQGHCHFWGGGAADADAARGVIRRQVQHGADLIKVMATGGRFTPGSAPLTPQFDQGTLDAIVTAAGQHHRKVAAHCHGTAGIEAAALAGVHSIEHCSWVGAGGWASDYSDEVARLIATRGIWVSPTINRGWQRMIDAGSGTVARMGDALSAMRDAGVPFMASTDAGIPGVFHHDLPRALPVYAEIARQSPLATLRAATVDAAAGLGLAEETGRLTPGQAADVLVVDGDPLTDLACLARPIAVWARGRAVRAP